VTVAHLQTVNLSRDFGGIHAVKSVSLAFEKNEIHAIIGPNGAGKTTLINLLSGDLPPSNGQVLFRGEDITGEPPDRIARLGLGRTYQQTHVIQDMTCRENCCLGVRDGNSGMGFVRPATSYNHVIAIADNVLELVELYDRADELAGSLSHGEQRQLEIGMVLATHPELLLLDEPLAGVGGGDSRRVIKLLKKISHTTTIVLIEHDMDAVFEMADMLTVMVNGAVLMTETPENVRSDVAVQRAYLGAPT